MEPAMTKSFFDKLVDGTESHARIGGRITYTYGPFCVQVITQQEAPPVVKR
jgi:hypothetical protein